MINKKQHFIILHNYIECPISLRQYRTKIVQMRRQIDNLIRDATNFGYDWHHIEKVIREKFTAALRKLERRKIIEIIDGEVKLL